jgi:hypothetical protein
MKTAIRKTLLHVEISCSPAKVVFSTPPGGEKVTIADVGGAL